MDADGHAKPGPSQSAATESRLRVVHDSTHLQAHPVTAAELRHRAVLIKAAAVHENDTLPAVQTALPWMSVWRDHRSYRTGVWRCVIDGSLQQPEYTAYRQRVLDFHTDMSRYLRPPEFTVIRCAVPDSGGGDNLILHIDDIIGRLRELGRGDIVDVLAEQRPLSMEDRHYNDGLTPAGTPVRAALATPDDVNVPCRIFDRHGATKGTHLELSDDEEKLFDEFLRQCHGQDDLAERMRLERGDILVFSNWRIMHARMECLDSGRVTEICMGNEMTPPREGEG
ncbi:TauD/TfdA family dioxygenase [Streptomyces sp. NPDC059785]|uniref:TauD/TfdA family dioxygenase n=1 Tax=unclassified Streptomyces TaxID=2593676 RepID=UPI00365B0F9A